MKKYILQNVKGLQTICYYVMLYYIYICFSVLLKTYGLKVPSTNHSTNYTL